MCCAGAAWVGGIFSMLLWTCANRDCRACWLSNGYTYGCTWQPQIAPRHDIVLQVPYLEGMIGHGRFQYFRTWPPGFESCLLSFSRKVWNSITPCDSMKKGRASPRRWVREVVILWIGRYLKCLPTPKAIHNSCNSSCFAHAIASTTTSTVLIKTFLRPLVDACFTWMKILVSTSSWLQAVRPSVSTGERLSTSTPDVVITSTPGSWIAVTLSAR